ncbi:MAG: DUF192 domain-containing protein [Phycisphaerae bacterium]|nr:DUF192 domain-containing protein [Phycisphaerae bacterium]
MQNRSIAGSKMWAVGVILAVVGILSGATCREIPRGSTLRNDLSAMRKVQIVIADRTSYTAYVADTPATHELGLMNVTEDDLPADHGMIFVFGNDQQRSFWMRNCVIPLDIAFIRSDGRIVKTYTMQPLNEVGYPSIEPARFALEVRGGQFARWGIVEGDHVEIPAELFDY